MTVPHHRKQSLKTALRHIRELLKRAKQTDFTTTPEDVALSTLYSAAITMYSFLQELSQDESICDCADRSWHGEGHDSQCNLERIARLLTEISVPAAPSFYVVFVEGDVEPHLYGPFGTAEARDNKARKLRMEDRQDLKSGIYRLDCTPAPRIDSYSAAFFEDDQDANTADFCAASNRS